MANALKEVVLRSMRSVARRRGYHLIPEWKLDSHTFARHLQKLFEHYRIDCVLDVGGNTGQYHDFLRAEIGFDGWIVSFEPVNKYIRHLQQRAAADSRWRIVDCALGAGAGTATINVTQSPGLNSFLAPSDEKLPGFWKGQQSSQENVRVARLDDLLTDLRAQTGFSRPYLKLDTQGFDLEVIKGAQQSLPLMRALQTEASVHAIYSGMPHWKESVATLEALGFRIERHVSSLAR